MKANPLNAKAQRNRLITFLKEHSECTTLKARHTLDILAVAPRIYELRHQDGYNIQTLWTEATNPGGGTHRVAKYVLFPGKWQGATKHVN